MKSIFIVFASLIIQANSYAQEFDCSLNDVCIKTQSILEFGEIEIIDVKEKIKTYSWGDKYREITIKVSSYFPTLLAGKPIIGTDYSKGQKVLFVMAPVSDLDAPSTVLSQFVIRANIGEELKLSAYKGLFARPELHSLSIPKN